MSGLLEQVSEQFNLRWAWEKVRRDLSQADVWVDPVQLARFELELEENLHRIGQSLVRGSYILTPIKPIPFPKDPEGDGTNRVRQMFDVSIADQVAWCAVVGIVGPYVDKGMPTWSYGNRLHRAIWTEDLNGVRVRRVGEYRNSGGRLYLPFSQSWPVFRRHVFLTTRAMSHAGATPLHGSDLEELAAQESLKDAERCPFVQRAHWDDKRPQGVVDSLHWGSIDIKKFYPSLKNSVARRNIVEGLPIAWRKAGSRLLRSMLDFRIDLTGWSDEQLMSMDIPRRNDRYVHIPTGLCVAGFLANAAMLAIDSEVDQLLKKERMAHFRFVDDHIFLSYTVDELINWSKLYQDVLRKHNVGARLNLHKTEPSELSVVFRNGRKPLSETQTKVLERSTRLDPQFPSPLMTKTIAIVSNIARTNLDLLEPDELIAITNQIEHLLLVDLPPKEIPERTRLSFAATKLLQALETRLSNDETWIVLELELREAQAAQKSHATNGQFGDDDSAAISSLKNRISDAKKSQWHDVARVFQMLRKTLREHPSKLRLWYKALSMCRTTGIDGIDQLFEDIRRLAKSDEKGALIATILRAKLASNLGSQLVIASHTLSSEDNPAWKRDAARQFLLHASKIDVALFADAITPFEQKAFRIACFAAYASSIQLTETHQGPDSPAAALAISAIGRIGEGIQQTLTKYEDGIDWVWWFSRHSNWQMNTQIDRTSLRLAQSFEPTDRVNKFWKFFPVDVPDMVLMRAVEQQDPITNARHGGWWYDALKNRTRIDLASNDVARRVIDLLSFRDPETRSLYEWCDFVSARAEVGQSDPRTGEWTALEIVRQITLLLLKKPVALTYFGKAPRLSTDLPNLHPANFRIPTRWFADATLDWNTWRDMVAVDEESQPQVSWVPTNLLLQDSRYTPIADFGPLFMGVNPVRGLGLMLHGLLKLSFDLPVMWNGDGHADVLSMLTPQLLSNLTYSSWTLGILEGCLQSRSAENLLFRSRQLDRVIGFDDSLRDSKPFVDVSEVRAAVEICQRSLQSLQMSTLNGRARQLTPIWVRQLTNPNWQSDFTQKESSTNVN